MGGAEAEIALEGWSMCNDVDQCYDYLEIMTN
jgi:hypothetical protein